MDRSPPNEPIARRAAWLNLLLPGGGLILCGAVASGLLIGLLFTCCANFALAAVLLFPDDFPRAWQALGIGVAGGSYVGAQLRLAQAVRSRHEAEIAALRRRVLAETQALLAQGDAARALETIRPLAALADQDLLVAYRLAQALTAAGPTHAARDAWQRVRRLDRHGLYRQQVRESEGVLRAEE